MIQFDWRRKWKTHVVPHLDNPLLVESLELGMTLDKPSWEAWMGPYSIGNVPSNGQMPRPGTLAWYQPVGCCHWIAFFSTAIGVLNYPDLDWQILTSALHSVPVGGGNGLTIVMDILNFQNRTAGDSIHAATKPHQDQVHPGEIVDLKRWRAIYGLFVERMVPRLRD